MYSPKWSQAILQEIERNLQHPKFNLSAEKAQYRVACMQTAFPEAMIHGYEPLVNAMPNHEKDRHVLAAAVSGRVDAIVTSNSKDFPEACLQQFGIARLTPDAFLVHQWHLDQDLVTRRLRELTSEHRLEWNSYLDLLARMTPRFVECVRRPEKFRPE